MDWILRIIFLFHSKMFLVVDKCLTKRKIFLLKKRFKNSLICSNFGQMLLKENFPTEKIPLAFISTLFPGCAKIFPQMESRPEKSKFENNT